MFVERYVHLEFFFFLFLSVQFCGEDSWTTRKYNQKTSRRDWCKDLCLGKGFNERQSQGKFIVVRQNKTKCPLVAQCPIWTLCASKHFGVCLGFDTMSHYVALVGL